MSELQHSNLPRVNGKEEVLKAKTKAIILKRVIKYSSKMGLFGF